MAGKNQFEDPYERLANAIILSAVADYRAALRKVKRNPKSKSVIDEKSLGSQKLPGLFARVAMKMPCLHEYLRSTATTRKLVFELWKEVSTCHIEVTYRVNILAVRHSFRTVRCIVRNISLYIQRTELMQQSVAMVPSGSVREGSS